jgi:hypothetical protein
MPVAPQRNNKPSDLRARRQLPGGGIYGGGPIAFHALIRDWRADGLKGLTID